LTGDLFRTPCHLFYNSGLKEMTFPEDLCIHVYDMLIFM
jgi:hypothetical protein